MDSEALAGMVFTPILTMLIGGFILLYPLSRRLGVLLEAKTGSAKPDADAIRAEIRKLSDSIASLESEVIALKERQEFTEKVIAARDRPALPTRPPAG